MRCARCDRQLRRVGTKRASVRVCQPCSRGWFDVAEQPAGMRIAERFVPATGVGLRVCPACGARALTMGSVGNLGMERCAGCGGVSVALQEAPHRIETLGWSILAPFNTLFAGRAVILWIDWLFHRASRRTAWPPRVPWESNFGMKRAFEEAVQRGDAEAVRQWLAAGADVDGRNQQGQSALMLAAHRGDLPLVRLLLEHRADPDQRAKYGLSALMLAVIGGHEKVALALARAGADLQIRGSGAPGFDGKTAADLAADREMRELAEALRPRLP